MIRGVAARAILRSAEYGDHARMYLSEEGDISGRASAGFFTFSLFGSLRSVDLSESTNQTNAGILICRKRTERASLSSPKDERASAPERVNAGNDEQPVAAGRRGRGACVEQLHKHHSS